MPLFSCKLTPESRHFLVISKNFINFDKIAYEQFSKHWRQFEKFIEILTMGENIIEKKQPGDSTRMIEPF